MIEADVRSAEPRVAVVTGAGAGIGRATAQLLGERGWTVAVWDLDEAAARACAGSIRRDGGNAAAFCCDISDRAGVEAAATATRESLGAVYALVNNAGTDRMGIFADSDPEDWRFVIDVNLLGTLHVTQVVMRDLLARGSGRIVSVSSDAARVGSTGEAVYAATKAGVLGFTKTLARELARSSVTVNAVCPGPTDTDLLENVRRGPTGDKIIAGMIRAVPLGRIADPRDIAGAIAYFLSDEAAYVTGQTLSVSGGLTMS